jgi:hypothetical protein
LWATSGIRDLHQAAQQRAGAPAVPAAAATLTLPAHRQNRRAVRAPRDVYVALHTDTDGVAMQAAGPFSDEADAKTYVDVDLHGRGNVVPLMLVFRRPRPDS